jgi:hypothetical protein
MASLLKPKAIDFSHWHQEDPLWLKRTSRVMSVANLGELWEEQHQLQSSRAELKPQVDVFCGNMTDDTSAGWSDIAWDLSMMKRYSGYPVAVMVAVVFGV